MLKEATDLLVLGEDLAKAIVAAKADGHVDWMDAPKFAGLIPDARAAIDGGNMVPGEFSTATREELVAYAERAFAMGVSLVAAVIK